jgi:Domain of unknown function (DUF4390)
MATRHPAALLVVLAVLVAISALGGAVPARAELRINTLSVFLNDYDVTIHVVLFGAVPDSLYEGIHSGIPAHVRLRVELWQYNRFLPDLRTQSRTVERQITYNPLTKEYKVLSVRNEHREPYLTKDLREAQRVISEFRVGNLIPAASLNAKELYYVRAQSAVSLSGINSWMTRYNGNAEETDWARSDLLTLTRRQ